MKAKEPALPSPSSLCAPCPQVLSEAPVTAVHRWASNAELIADVARLGFITSDDVTLDPTYGRGAWWKLWRPDVLVTHDLRSDGVDFRQLPESDASVDVVAFDPPYTCVGGRTTSGIPEMHDRYGLTEAP